MGAQLDLYPISYGKCLGLGAAAAAAAAAAEGAVLAADGGRPGRVLRDRHVPPDGFNRRGLRKASAMVPGKRGKGVVRIKPYPTRPRRTGKEAGMRAYSSWMACRASPLLSQTRITGVAVAGREGFHLDELIKRVGTTSIGVVLARNGVKLMLLDPRQELLQGYEATHEGTERYLKSELGSSERLGDASTSD